MVRHNPKQQELTCNRLIKHGLPFLCDKKGRTPHVSHGHLLIKPPIDSHPSDHHEISLTTTKNNNLTNSPLAFSIVNFPVHHHDMFQYVPMLPACWTMVPPEACSRRATPCRAPWPPGRAPAAACPIPSAWPRTFRRGSRRKPSADAAAGRHKAREGGGRGWGWRAARNG